MTERHPKQRATYFDEVSLGYSLIEAQYEAARCIQCKDPACVKGCPVGINIPGFLDQIINNDLEGAMDTVWDSTALPAICGRVCPQEIQCEEVCVVKNDKKGFFNEKYICECNINELKALFSFDWEKIKHLKNVKLEVFIGEFDKIIASKKAFNFFSNFGDVYFIKKANHFLRS